MQSGAEPTDHTRESILVAVEGPAGERLPR
jgi:hypothetical protein